MCKECLNLMPVLLHLNTYSLTRQGSTRTRRRGRNIIGNRAIVDVPGLRGGNVTMCAAIGHRGVIHHHAQFGPYNTARLLTFLDVLNNIFIPPQEEGPEQPNYIIWDNVSFHRAALVHNWFAFQHGGGRYMTANPMSVWPYSRQWRRCVMTSTQTHARGGSATPGAFPRCLARENIACDVDEVLWPDQDRRRDD
ncbi:hypothetical protein AAFF_G00350860 [Aldrovandia affinis]|uniref:Tc1-like transposase DDE domain-containing protein n=1 Tax=Aldrovandia affinis TaxID=143900 RepID=A0AAD7VZL4_9TELE|nr:hypothetical protein AAFF_G00350860 [Aldrovandia affinis]